ncbi:4994_t:CDS:2 [Acaulospora morrowiae]|uniref:4994_t:CDS:1 n=1 Tax=Acaulospora morrowiae TaxID=94023 RepID=A0A9N9APU1_9GLOM|nr:4994_t:CDS:2 [Acaulospora morrowiae]
MYTQNISKEFSIEIVDYCPIGPTAHIPLPETLPKRNNDFIEELNMDNIPIPVPVSTSVYQKFEENNPEISLCVYEWNNQNKCLEFRYMTERRGDEYKQVNLLVITEENRSHYCIIKDLHKRTNALEKFVDKLEEELAEIQADLLSPAKIIMEPGDHITFNEATECYICKKPFIEPAPEIYNNSKKQNNNC